MKPDLEIWKLKDLEVEANLIVVDIILAYCIDVRFYIWSRTFQGGNTLHLIDLGEY